MGGEYFTLKPGAELPGDQRSDDGGSVTFETEPLGEAVELLGRPVLQVTLRCAAATALLAARPVDVHPDGTATRISLGVQNPARSAERRVGKEGVSTCRARWASYDNQTTDNELLQKSNSQTLL